MDRRRTWTTTAAAVLVVGTMSWGAGPAAAADDPVGGLTKTVKGTVKGTVTGTVNKVGSSVRSGLASSSGGSTGKVDAKSPSRNPGQPSSSDHSGANDVEDPQAPDHGGADVLTSQVGGNDAVGAGSTNSTVEDDDSTHSDASPITLGGQDVTGTGAHASSGGNQHASSPSDQATDPVCSGSSGGLCLDVLYADASATDNGSTSSSSSETELVGACAGGTETSTSTSENCDGPVAVGAGGSDSAAHRNQQTGRTTASSGSYLFDACLNAPSGGLPGLPGLPGVPGLPGLPVPGAPALPTDGSCALGADAIGSTGQADSGGDSPSAQRSSSLLVTSAGGQQQEIDEPEALELPPGCPAGTSLLCGYLNQGETYLGADGLAGTAQEALKLRLLPGLIDADVLSLVGGRSETLVHNDGGEAPVVQGDTGTSSPTTSHATGVARAATVAGVESAAPTGGLPNTGGPSMGLLSAGLLAAGAGAILVAASRLRRFGLTTT